MPTIAEIKELAFALPDAERASLGADLIASLPPFLEDDDEGYAEARRRIAEYEADPSLGMTLDEFKAAMLQAPN
ncbi:MAG TPA: addiction module protein [Chthoniobacteraceae bacterium]|jgi:putative addiction module component (TIGR02574 family)|nr:addiction module protein [Chthoniobacteraceae bacterium]